MLGVIRHAVLSMIFVKNNDGVQATYV